MFSEVEFEYVLCVGISICYWWGDGVLDKCVENFIGVLDCLCNGCCWSNVFCGYCDVYWGLVLVMSFVVNLFGLYDINGNVFEWVVDCWYDSYLCVLCDGSVWINLGCSVYVVCGGFWGSVFD